MSVPADQLAPPVRLRRAWLFAAAAVGMFTFGVIIALLGTLFGLPAMRARLDIDLAQQGDLFSVLSLGMLLSSLAAGPALDRFGSKRILVAASAMATVGLLAFALAAGFPAAAAAAVLVGFGGAWLNIGTNALVSDVYPGERGRMLNLLGVFFGLGALFVPLIVTVGFDRLSVTGTLMVCAGVAATATLLGILLEFPPAHEGDSFSFVEMLRAARHPGVMLFAALLFFESGNEASLSGWTSTYIGAVGWSPFTATVILLGYWVMAILGRLVSARAQARLGKERLVLVSGLLSAAGCLLLLAGSGSLPLLIAGAWLTALALASIFPTTLAIAGDRYQRFSGTVFGFLFSAGSIGTMSFPWAVGHVSQAAGLRLGMLVPLAGTVLVCACAVAVARLRPRP